ncbi:nucleoside triphosphate pyrophosphohydrolase [Palleronia caenipelagi]|uniref:Nucleoside triphosphate pyrophosphohydrolase n=1 Tax=Palleronia caenipelagi TaxID=2489174 RepID=A0A547QAN2_9RHOB|nr:nucleoside triphosphate pyrophosphohydrolase [Palleronia caenipelagi]TRD23457.1 nucleoside triphosphate pyrophosphohydrolase [Palleronia caenipelagi]
MTQKDDRIFETPAGLERLKEVMARLRDPETGCPWDVEQTFATIAPYTIEEAYEVEDAISRGNMEDLCGELGDLMFQSVFHARMAEEVGAFTLEDVVNGITEKMIARHPHVFGTDSRDKSAEQQVIDWDLEKARERARRNETGALDGVALGLPALMRAEKLQKRAARVGFDWPDISGVTEKLIEEASELTDARQKADPAEIFEEVGDLLFTVVNLARHLGVDAESALRASNDKFHNRFAFLETALAAAGESPADLSLEELDAFWEAAKQAESDRIRDQDRGQQAVA